jgi:hypothetical protein
MMLEIAVRFKRTAAPVRIGHLPIRMPQRRAAGQDDSHHALRRPLREGATLPPCASRQPASASFLAISLLSGTSR